MGVRLLRVLESNQQILRFIFTPLKLDLVSKGPEQSLGGNLCNFGRKYISLVRILCEKRVEKHVCINI